MDKESIETNTWQDVLTTKGFNHSTVSNLIGFISWNKGEEHPKLGREITELLSTNEGKVFVKDVTSMNFNDKGLLFFSNDVSEETANEIFDVIMDYEQNEVYSTL